MRKRTTTARAVTAQGATETMRVVGLITGLLLAWAMIGAI